MTIITDEFMRDMRARTKAYTVVLLKAAPGYYQPGADTIIWEHGRRQFSLRADGVLSIVCPVADDSDLAGVNIFDASAEEAAGIMDDVMTWAGTPAATEVELTFAALGPALTRVAVEHRGWEQLTEEQLAADCALRGGYLGGAYREGWARILGCLAAVTGGQS